MATLVGSALFGDGAAAVVAVGERRAEKIGAPRARRARLAQPALPRLAAARWAGTSARTDSELVLSPDLPDLIEHVSRPTTSPGSSASTG